MGLSGFSWVNRGSYLSSLLSCKCFVRSLDEWVNLGRHIRWCAVSRGSSFTLSVFGMFGALDAFLVLSVH